MICKYCNKEISDGSAFCNFCGNTLGGDDNTNASNEISNIKNNLIILFESELNAIISAASNRNADLNSATKKITKKTKSINTVDAIKKAGDETMDNTQTNNSNAPLLKLNMISHYKGEKAIGIAESAGQLIVYKDRVEYKRQLGNAAAGAFGLVAYIASAKKAKNQGVLMFAMDQIKEAREGTYAGVLTSIIIETKYGECHTFSNSINRSGMLKCIEEINKHKM